MFNQKVVNPLLVLFILFFFALESSAQEIIPNEFIIKFSETLDEENIKDATKNMNLEMVRKNSITNTYYLIGPIDEEQSEKYITDGKIDFLEPNCIIEQFVTANDRLNSAQWGLNNVRETIDIDANEAWDITQGSDEVIVGVIDSGINYLHPDLINNIWENPDEIPDNGIDDDGNGVIDDYHGFNAVNGSGDPIDNNGHGSHVSGIIGAESNNNIGVSGINWNVKLMGLKFLDGAGAGTTQNAIRAIEYAVQMKRDGHNIRVLNNSWGGTLNSAALREAVVQTQAADILFVAASGNFGSDNDIRPIYPASYNLSNVVSVSAIDREGNLPSFANHGSESVDLAAPGMEIVSTGLGADYSLLSGTSMASPHVVGVAALLVANEPNLSAEELKTRLVSTARPLRSLNGLLKNPGIVNAAFALENIIPEPLEDELEEVYTLNSVPSSATSDLGEKIFEIDDGYADINLPFSFPYFNETFNRLAISANGRVIPLSNTDPLPSEADFDNALREGILPWHDDLLPDGTANGGVWARIDNDSVIISWFVRSFEFRNSTNPVDNIHFELSLSANGTIEFDYIDIETSQSSSEIASGISIGIVPSMSGSGETVNITHNSPVPELVFNQTALRFTLNGQINNAPEETKRVNNDYDGDGKSDIIVWRPSNGYFFILTSESNFDFESHVALQLGLPGDIPKTGYFDGDNRLDFAVFRPQTGQWFIRYSEEAFGEIRSYGWGLFGDIPIVGDLDGDGRSELNVYRPDAGVLFSLLSSSEFNPLAENSIISKTVGAIGYDAMLEDLNNDGIDDILALDNRTKHWFGITLQSELLVNIIWGIPTDRSLVCDLDGNGLKELMAVRDRPDVFWLDWFSSENPGQSSFGLIGDIPNCSNDYDGDGQEDQRVWRPSNGFWYIATSSFNKVRNPEDVVISRQFGLPGDITF